MAVPDRVITIRTFWSAEEIRELEGFSEGNLVTQQNYAALVGDYRLPEKEKCCLFRDGRRCSVGHNYGFVVILKDQTISIVGNKCANDNFGAESVLARDMRAYNNEKARQNALRRLAEIMATRESFEAQASEMYEKLKELSERARGLLLGFGSIAARQIQQMARGTSGRVDVTGVRLRPYTDEDGRENFERTAVEITVGHLAGLAFFNADRVKEVQNSLRSIAAAYRDAERLDESATTKTLTRITGVVAGLPGMIDSGQRLLDMETAFMKSDWSALPFLVADKSECLKLVRVVLAHADTPGGKDRAKEWLSQKEAALRMQHNVQKISW